MDFGQATSEAPGRCLVGAGDARWKRWFRFDVGGHNQNFSDCLFYGFIWFIYRMGLCLYGMVYLKLFFCVMFIVQKNGTYIYIYIVYCIWAQNKRKPIGLSSGHQSWQWKTCHV